MFRVSPEEMSKHFFSGNIQNNALLFHFTHNAIKTYLSDKPPNNNEPYNTYNTDKFSRWDIKQDIDYEIAKFGRIMTAKYTNILNYLHSRLDIDDTTRLIFDRNGNHLQICPTTITVHQIPKDFILKCYLSTLYRQLSQNAAADLSRCFYPEHPNNSIISSELMAFISANASMISASSSETIRSIFHTILKQKKIEIAVQYAGTDVMNYFARCIAATYNTMKGYFCGFYVFSTLYECYIPENKEISLVQVTEGRGSLQTLLGPALIIDAIIDD
jgi:hypothetical protein